MKGQQPHIIMVHLSKCWSTNFSSLTVHGPTRQNPTSPNSLLKVCSNSGGHAILDVLMVLSPTQQNPISSVSVTNIKLTVTANVYLSGHARVWKSLNTESQGEGDAYHHTIK